MSVSRPSISRLATLILSLSAFASPCLSQTTQTSESRPAASRESEIAGRFAPIFYQALGDKPRSDYITNFDFDGDWRGDNNWIHTDDLEFPLKAYVYYSLVETTTHYFIHYALFHPRDYKGGERKGTILSEIIREGAKRGGRFDPTGLADETALAHENDMEGCLVVVQKNRNAADESHVVYVETMHHNNFSRYVTGENPPGLSSVRLEEQRAVLYVEPKGHGIEAFTGDEKQVSKKEFVRYVYGQTASVQSDNSPRCTDVEVRPCTESVGYALAPIDSTLWPRAKGEANLTFGLTCDYAPVSLRLLAKNGKPKLQKFKIGKVGCAFLGKVGGHNMARPPWGWFDKDERKRALGLWFFDPASIVKLDFQLNDEFSTTYVKTPFWAR